MVDKIGKSADKDQIITRRTTTTSSVQYTVHTTYDLYDDGGEFALRDGDNALCRNVGKRVDSFTNSKREPEWKRTIRSWIKNSSFLMVVCIVCGIILVGYIENKNI